MKRMSLELFRSARLLLPTNRFRWQLALLVLIAAAIPVTELLVAKLFTDLVIDGANRSIVELGVSIAIFALLFVGTRVANYIQKTYRVKFFDRAFGLFTSMKIASVIIFFLVIKINPSILELSIFGKQTSV